MKDIARRFGSILNTPVARTAFTNAAASLPFGIHPIHTSGLPVARAPLAPAAGGAVHANIQQPQKAVSLLKSTLPSSYSTAGFSGAYTSPKRRVHNAAQQPNTLNAVTMPKELSRQIQLVAEEHLKNNRYWNPRTSNVSSSLYNQAFDKWRETLRTKEAQKEAAEFRQAVTDFYNGKTPATIISGLPIKKIPEKITHSINNGLWQDDDFRYNVLVSDMVTHGYFKLFNDETVPNLYHPILLQPDQPNGSANALTGLPFHVDGAEGIANGILKNPIELIALTCINPGTDITQIINPKELYNSLSSEAQSTLLKPIFQYLEHDDNGGVKSNLFSAFKKEPNGAIQLMLKVKSRDKIIAVDHDGRSALDELYSKINNMVSKKKLAEIIFDRPGDILLTHNNHPWFTNASHRRIPNPVCPQDTNRLVLRNYLTFSKEKGIALLPEKKPDIVSRFDLVKEEQHKGVARS